MSERNPDHVRKSILNEITMRRFVETDSVEEINTLLRFAYRPLAEAGMRYAASYEDVDATTSNLSQAECYVAVLHLRIVGCVMLRAPGVELGPSWYSEPGVATFGRFAVRAEYQGRGIGSMMIDHIESLSRERGVLELALDTSEHAHHLIRMYEKRGYRFIQYHQWQVTNYRSVVLSKCLQKISG